MDDMAYPSYSSARIKSSHMTFNEGLQFPQSVPLPSSIVLTCRLVGDTMIRELDFSKITLRIIEHVDKDGDGDDDHVIAKLTGSTIDTLRRCLVGHAMRRVCVRIVAC